MAAGAAETGDDAADHLAGVGLRIGRAKRYHDLLSEAADAGGPVGPFEAQQEVRDLGDEVGALHPAQVGEHGATVDTGVLDGELKGAEVIARNPGPLDPRQGRFVGLWQEGEVRLAVGVAGLAPELLCLRLDRVEESRGEALIQLRPAGAGVLVEDGGGRAVAFTDVDQRNAVEAAARGVMVDYRRRDEVFRQRVIAKTRLRIDHGNGVDRFPVEVIEAHG